MKKCLIVVDYQYDFVAKDGLLTAGECARDIEKNIYSIMAKYKENNDDIIFTLDTHEKMNWGNHMESKSFNLHCEKGTKGHEPYKSTKQFLTYENMVLIEKKGYAPNIKDIELISLKYSNIEFCGIITDICVLQTAIMLYNTSINIDKNIKFSVNKDACASFDTEGHKFALKYMQNILGFDIV